LSNYVRSAVPVHESAILIFRYLDDEFDMITISRDPEQGELDFASALHLQARLESPILRMECEITHKTRVTACNTLREPLENSIKPAVLRRLFSPRRNTLNKSLLTIQKSSKACQTITFESDEAIGRTRFCAEELELMSDLLRCKRMIRTVSSQVATAANVRSNLLQLQTLGREAASIAQARNELISFKAAASSAAHEALCRSHKKQIRQVSLGAAQKAISLQISRKQRLEKEKREQRLLRAEAAFVAQQAAEAAQQRSRSQRRLSVLPIRSVSSFDDAFELIDVSEDDEASIISETSVVPFFSSSPRRTDIDTRRPLASEDEEEEDSLSHLQRQVEEVAALDLWGSRFSRKLATVNFAASLTH